MTQILLNPWVIGIGTAVVAGLILSLLNKDKKNTNLEFNSKDNHAMNQTVTVNNIANNDQLFAKKDSVIKDNIKILFVDDDTTFKIVGILKNAGWRNTSIIDDIKDVDTWDVKNTDIFFIDIKGVGLSFSAKHQGLALAEKIKDKYPLKKVVIYSSDIKGDRSHAALQKVDWFLNKYAEPIEFFNLLEKLTS